MSVIGRMDKQVDDVLISPLARKNQQETQAGGENIAPQDKDQAERETTPVQRGREEQDELPVWLL